MLKAHKIPREFFIFFFLIVITLAVFWQVKNHEFINYDDTLYVTENYHVQAGLTLEGLKWAFTTSHAGYWHPLTWLSHMADCQVFGLRPGWHHLMNLFFHIANTLLLFLVLHRMTKALWQSAFVAALFAVHPLHVESVAWVAERKDVLSTLFWMLTMGAYVYYVEHPGYRRYLLVLAFFVLGLLSKPMLVTLPFVLLLLDYWPLGRLQLLQRDGNNPYKTARSEDFVRKKQKAAKVSTKKVAHVNKRAGHPLQWSMIRLLLLEKVPFFAFAVVSSAITFFNSQHEGVMSSLKAIPLDSRIANAFVSYVSYIGKMVWPHNLAVFYPYPGMLPTWQALGAALFLIAITFLVIRVARRLPYLAVGWLWYLGTLIPVIGIVQVGAQAMADRYTYIPLIGLFVMISWGIPDLLKKSPYRKIILRISSVVIVLTLAGITWMQIQYWQNSITLFRHTLSVTTNNASAYYSLGNAFQSRENMEDAIRQYSEALRINPNYADVHNNLGTILRRKGNIREAIDHYTEAIRINPNHANAYNNIGNILFAQGKTAEAIMYYTTAIRIDPNLAEAHLSMGKALIAQNKTAEAIPHFQEVLKIKPDNTEAYVVLGDISFEQGRIAESVNYYNKALEMNYDLPEIHYNLGNILSSQRRFDEAIPHFHEALRIKPDYAKAHNNLGSALLFQGKIEEAIVHFREALRIKPDYTMAQSNLRDALAHRKKLR